MAYGQVRASFNLAHPEHVTNDKFVQCFMKVVASRIRVCIVDEAHFLLSWGCDDYIMGQRFKKILPEIKIVAMTATATPSSQKMIAEELRMVNPTYVTFWPVRAREVMKRAPILFNGSLQWTEM